MNDLPEPKGRQREVLYLPAEGHTVVLGTAGSGKTTLAILRSAYLAEPSTTHCGRTLLVTFNRALVSYLQHLRPASFHNVIVENYHTFARGYLNSRGKMPINCILDDNDLRNALIVKAIEAVKVRYQPHSFFARPPAMFSEEIRWMLSHGICTLDKYIEVERVGRFQSRIEREMRKIMFEILQKYLEFRKGIGKVYDWDDLALHANMEFAMDATERNYKHIVIDEGQDFSPEMLRSLASSIPTDGSLTFFGDVAQQIYGQRMTWRSAGLNIQKAWKFQENYRNTKEIAQLGLAIAEMPYFDGGADMVAPTSFTVAGDQPTLVQCKSVEDEIDIAIRIAKANAGHQSVAILFKNREQEEQVTRQLTDHASVRLHRRMTTWQAGPGIKHGTYHSAKGLEFDLVILPFLSQSNIPEQADIDSTGKEDALKHFGRLLYVAVTRAKTRLILTYTGQLTELLPSDGGLYKKVKR